VRTAAPKDVAFGASAEILLVVGLLRIVCFKNGAAYYLHRTSLIIRLSLFVAIGLL
jgi:putative membrane protein